MSTENWTSSQAKAAVRAFLENAPLYQGLTNRSKYLGIPDAITYECRKCKDRTTWKISTANGPASSEHHVVYKCVLCDDETVSFLLHRSEDGVMRKIGQWPAWSVAVAPEVARALPADVLPFYKKGVICLSQSFGVAALAYFRRVVEEVVDHLVGLVEAGMDTYPNVEQREAMRAEISAARQSQRESELLAIIARVLPEALRTPDGANPLARLYSRYSEGLHAQTDEECVDVAIELRAMFDFALVSLTQQLQLAQSYQATMAATRTPSTAR